ncbi:MAG: 4Fe-4S binding protein [Myxococcota bacterium]
MRSLAGATLSWIRRLWTPAPEAPPTHPGVDTITPVSRALAGVEGMICDGVVHRAAVPANAALARRMSAGDEPPRNVFGGRVVEEEGADARGAVSVATGMALAGLRASAFIEARELRDARGALEDAARRLVPLVVHVHGAAAAPEALPAFQLAPMDGQQAVDLTLLARWLAEQALLPGLVTFGADGVERLRLPEEKIVRDLLGFADEPVDSPTAAQRVLFGNERRRTLRWFDPDRPVATGTLRPEEAEAEAAAARRLFFEEHLPALAREGMEALSRVTGRPLSFVDAYGLRDADVVLVAAGETAARARGVAEALRAGGKRKIGVLGLPWLHPLPAEAIADALGDRPKPVVVLEPSGDGATLSDAVRRAAGRPEGRWLSAATPDRVTVAHVLEALEAAGHTDGPDSIRLDRPATAAEVGFPRRDALLQSLRSGYPSLAREAAPGITAPPRAAGGVRTLLTVVRDADLPPDLPTRVADALATKAAPAVRGAVTHPRADQVALTVESGEEGFAPLGPGAPADAALVVSGDLRGLGEPLDDVVDEGTLFLATDAEAADAWKALPPSWRDTVRQRSLGVLLVRGGEEAWYDALSSWAADKEIEAEALDVSTLEDPPATKKPLPQVITRIDKARPAHDSLPRFWGEVVEPLQATGHLDGADPLSATGVVPACSTALAPEPAPATPLAGLDSDACTACGACWAACPDSAVGATVLDVEALFTAASEYAGTSGKEADALRRAHKHLAGRVAKDLAKAEASSLDAATCRGAYDWLVGKLGVSDDDRKGWDAAFDATLDAVLALDAVVSERFFHGPEKASKGSGELLVLAVDPRTCQGCGMCVTACPDDALSLVARAGGAADDARDRWTRWEALPDTSGETIERAVDATDGGLMSAMLLSRHCAQAQIGGAAGEAGSGERLDGRLLAAAVEYHGQRHTAALVKELDDKKDALDKKARELILDGFGEADVETLSAALGESVSDAVRGRAGLGELGDRLQALGTEATFDRRAVLRMTHVAAELGRHAKRLSEGVDGLGRARFGVVVASDGAGSWAARYPANPFYAPVTLDTSAESAELARGLVRGLVADHLDVIRTARRADLVAKPPADLPVHLDAVDRLGWEDLTQDERAACPPLVLLGDELLLRRGFGALTGLLTSDLPVKIVVLDGHGDLARPTDPGILAMAHRAAYVLAGSPAFPAHLGEGLRDAMAFDGPALVHLDAPSPSRHGFAADRTLEVARLAVEGRVHPLLRYDPRGEGWFGARASLEGNPALDAAWGEATVGDWAAAQERFADRFTPHGNGGSGDDLGEVAALAATERSRKTAVVERGEDRLVADDALVEAAAARLGLWQTLREVAGVESPFVARLREELKAELQADHEGELAALRKDLEARIDEARGEAEREAVSRLRERLMHLAGYTRTN